ncbi:rho guanine nucleotide exchange factor 8 [Carex littledalei]|uniref:Rho guanine nucleotide exchange factor 8 n=1 Tax=Carex littledalei TaxID=544730 RepID=A0A833VGZ1_9POAL|nr:rho guanine nucleotide exchange factor 8 [Carex littledalei]
MSSLSGRRSQSLVIDMNSNGSQMPSPVLEREFRGSKIEWVPERSLKSQSSREYELRIEMEHLKEKFAKLLLCEDMSGSGRKGVSPALTLSNAITNLAASVFGEQRRFEPMEEERKARWKREIDWLLSVSEHIVEFVPTQQTLENGTTIEVMRNQQRKDLHLNIPALRKLDAMLLEYLDESQKNREYWYGSKEAGPREDEKWWLPTVNVPPKGLSDKAREHLQNLKEKVNQVLKAAMAINANSLAEMEVPEAYIESLPKNGRAILGDAMYKIMGDEFFDPDELLSSVDLSSEHKIVDLKNRIEASVVIWRRKMNNKDTKSPWGVASGVSQEKREQFEDRAETILLILKHRYPGIPQSSLDISKIQDNRDMGYAILESYSRVLESLAFTVLSRIEDVIYADNLAKDPSLAEKKRRPPSSDSCEPIPVITFDPKEEAESINKMEPNVATLSDFMGWSKDQDQEPKQADSEAALNQEGRSSLKKTLSPALNKRHFYLESLNALRSPLSRH